MNRFKDDDFSVNNRLNSFFMKKSIWLWWAGHTLIAGIIFGILYLAYTIFTVKWWVSLSIVAGVGIFWGSIAYISHFSKRNVD